MSERLAGATTEQLNHFLSDQGVKG